MTVASALGGSRASASVAAVGALSIALLLLARSIDHGLIEREEALAHAVDAFLIDITSAHLWLEEHVSGDDVDADRVRMHLHRGDRALASLSEPAVTLDLRRDLERFRELSESRLRGYARGEDVGVGSSVDVRYDAAFAELFDGAGSLSATIDLRLARSREREALLFRAIVVSWTALVALGAIVLWTVGRRRALAERALGESRERLLRAQKTELAGRLASGLAHDVNSYLGAIRAQAELIDAESDRHAASRRAAAIVRVVDNAAGLIDRLLTFAQQRPVQPRLLDPNRLLRHETDSWLDRLLGDRVSLVMDLDEGAWPFVLDPGQLQQIVVNLAVNARDAMPEGGHITVRTRNVSIDDRHPLRPIVPIAGEYAALSVTDTGQGIAPDLQRRIFEPYVSTKERSGSGLGLATVAAIVEAAGGGIAVESEEGRGATFTVLLPRATSDADRLVVD